MNEEDNRLIPQVYFVEKVSVAGPAIIAKLKIIEAKITPSGDRLRLLH